MGETGKAVMEKAGGRGGSLEAAGKLGTSIGDIQGQVDAWRLSNDGSLGRPGPLNTE